jgi:hypothetical protein
VFADFSGLALQRGHPPPHEHAAGARCGAGRLAPGMCHSRRCVRVGACMAAAVRRGVPALDFFVAA